MACKLKCRMWPPVEKLELQQKNYFTHDYKNCNDKPSQSSNHHLSHDRYIQLIGKRHYKLNSNKISSK